MKKGVWLAAGAYGIWGLFPIYWKWLKAVPATQLLAHRIAWSFLLLLAILLISRRWSDFRLRAFARRTVGIYLLAAVLIAANWLTYVWAVNAGFVVEASLGYFINPLVSVMLGVIILRERLRPFQWIPVGLAAAGVAYLTIEHGSLPAIALTLAFTFGMYGLVKKLAPLGSLEGLTLETGLLFVPALGFLIYAESAGQGAFLRVDPASSFLLIGAGLVTTVPLLMFSSATQRIPLSLMGVLQYITPTLQFLLGILVYRESFVAAQFIGFGLVWLALLVFGLEGIVSRPARPVPAPAD